MVKGISNGSEKKEKEKEKKKYVRWSARGPITTLSPHYTIIAGRNHPIRWGEYQGQSRHPTPQRPIQLGHRCVSGWKENWEVVLMDRSPPIYLSTWLCPLEPNTLELCSDPFSFWWSCPSNELIQPPVTASCFFCFLAMSHPHISTSMDLCTFWMSKVIDMSRSPSTVDYITHAIDCIGHRNTRLSTVDTRHSPVTSHLYPICYVKV